MVSSQRCGGGSRANRLQRTIARGSVALGLVWLTCTTSGGLSNFVAGNISRYGALHAHNSLSANAKEEAAPNAGSAGTSGSSLPTHLVAPSALILLSAAGLRANKRSGRQPQQRAAVQLGPWRKRLASFFGIKDDSDAKEEAPAEKAAEPAPVDDGSTLRDQWQELADQAAKVAPMGLGKVIAVAKPKPKPKPAAVPEVKKEAEVKKEEVKKEEVKEAPKPAAASSSSTSKPVPAAAPSSTSSSASSSSSSSSATGGVTKEEAQRYGLILLAASLVAFVAVNGPITQ